MVHLVEALTRNCINSQSVCSKLPGLRNLAAHYECFVIGVAETLAQPGISDVDLVIQGMEDLKTGQR